MGSNLPKWARKSWQTISSTKTGVILLIVVLIASAAGTVVLQRPATDPDELESAYSPQVLRFFDALGLTDVYHAWWFVLLLVLVSVCIVAASIERFPNSWRYYARPYKSPDDSFRKALPVQTKISIPNEEDALDAAEHACHEFGYYPERVVGHGRTSLFAERNRVSEMAVYIVHASLLLIFLGGIIDALNGWRGSVSLTAGEQTNQVALRNGASRPLPFAIRCDGTGQENYPDGTPKRWWSNLAVVEDGKDVQRKEIAVNDPLVYGGVRFYQSSYGSTGKVDKLVLTATPAEDKGSATQIVLGLNEKVALDAGATVQLAEFIPDYVVGDGHVYTRSNKVENPAVHLLVESGGKTVNVWLPPIPGFEENARSPYRFEAQDLRMVHYTGLQVSHEPGQWAVWSGVILMGIGLGLVFYLVHERIWIVPVRDPRRGQWSLWVGGAANKNRDVFEKRFQRLAGRIEFQVRAEERSAQERAASLAGD